MDLNAGFEAIRPWIGPTGVWGLVVLFFLNYRKLSMQSKVDDRQGYGALIEALQGDIKSVREQHKQCEDRLSSVENQLLGVHRQMVMASSNAVLPPGAPSPMVQDAAARARDIMGDGGAPE